MTLSEIYSALDNKDYETVTIGLKQLNDSYRNGNSEVSDVEYDTLLQNLSIVDPYNDIFSSGIIETVNSDRKEKLKYPMFSLDKDTSIDDIIKWLVNKGLPLSIVLVITAKYDGISILKNERTSEAWTRGDGFEGETMHEHYKKLGEKNSTMEFYTIGEMIIPKLIFNGRTFYRDNGEPFKNARNMIAGLKNSDTISDDLKYAKHIRYGLADDDFTKNKSEQLDFISKELHSIPYKKFRADELDPKVLDELFIEWGKEYDIDGLVIDIDDKNIRKQLGRERNNNPSYTRAYKNPNWSQSAETELIDIEWNISKQGYLKPTGILEPIELDGVTVSRVTLNNAKFVKDNDLGPGSKVLIIRSGMVIPKVIKVIESTGFEIPVESYWNENGVELCVFNSEEQEIKKIISFFEILKTDNVSEGIIRQLYDAGYQTIKEILNLEISDLEKLDKFGKRKAMIVYESIKKSTTDVELSKLMHASNLFNNLGSKKLELLVHFQSKPSREDVVSIDGFSDISANNFIDAYDEFYEFIKDLPITIKIKKETIKNNKDMKNDFSGREFVFTGFRDAELKDLIEKSGGIVRDGINKKTTDLLTKTLDTSSAKAVKARSIGANVIQVDEFKKMLK